MHIDVLSDISDDEYNHYVHVAYKYIANRYYSGINYFNLYSYFPDAPYWGEGNDCYVEDIWDDEPSIMDPNYYEWFDNLLTHEDKCLIQTIQSKIHKVTKQFNSTDNGKDVNNQDKWVELPSYIDEFEALKYLTSRNIPYVTVRQYPEFKENAIYVKYKSIPIALNSDSYILHKTFIEQGWVCINLNELNSNELINTGVTMYGWIEENFKGLYKMRNNMYVEFESDAMALKLVFGC